MITLADNIFDLAQNSIFAGAKSIQIIVEEKQSKNEMKITITDDGQGIKPEQIVKVKNTFYTTRDRSKRKVGLGLSLMDATCIHCGGELLIESEYRYGTTVNATMEHDHIDRPPLGDLADIYTSLLTSTSENKIKWKLEHRVEEKSYELTNRKVLDDLNLLSLSEANLRQLIYNHINKKEIKLNTRYGA